MLLLVVRRPPRWTSASISTRTTSPPTAAPAPTSLTSSGFRNNGTIAQLDRLGTLRSRDSPTTGHALVRDRTSSAMRSRSLTPHRCAPVSCGEDLVVELNQGSTIQYLTAPNTFAGQTLGGIKTSFTIQAWVKPTDCGANGGVPTIVSKAFSFMIGCDDGTWHYILGDGTAWHTGNWSTPVSLLRTMSGATLP